MATYLWDWKKSKPGLGPAALLSLRETRGGLLRGLSSNAKWEHRELWKPREKPRPSLHGSAGRAGRSPGSSRGRSHLGPHLFSAGSVALRPGRPDAVSAESCRSPGREGKRRAAPAGQRTATRQRLSRRRDQLLRRRRHPRALKEANPGQRGAPPPPRPAPPESAAQSAAVQAAESGGGSSPPEPWQTPRCNLLFHVSTRSSLLAGATALAAAVELEARRKGARGLFSVCARNYTHHSSYGNRRSHYLEVATV